jgi:hypothetical protein
MPIARLAALALIVAGAGCGSASPPAAHPTAYATTAGTAAAAARAVIASRYGVDDAASTPGRIVSRIDWLDDASRWAAQRRIQPGEPTSRTTSFQVIATIEPAGPGQVAVRVEGIVAGSDARLPGQGPATIETGDARMPPWADARVDAVRVAIDGHLTASAR